MFSQYCILNFRFLKREGKKSTSIKHDKQNKNSRNPDRIRTRKVRNKFGGIHVYHKQIFQHQSFVKGYQLVKNSQLASQLDRLVHQLLITNKIYEYIMYQTHIMFNFFFISIKSHFTNFLSFPLFRKQCPYSYFYNIIFPRLHKIERKKKYQKSKWESETTNQKRKQKQKNKKKITL